MQNKDVYNVYQFIFLQNVSRQMPILIHIYFTYVCSKCPTL